MSSKPTRQKPLSPTDRSASDECTRTDSYSRASVLLERAWALRTEDPKAAEKSAREALEVLERDQPMGATARAVNDLRARAWIYLANCRRIRSDLREAENMLKRAEKYLQEGTHAPQERARFLQIRAGLLLETRSFRQAIDLMDQVVAIQRWANDHGALAQALLTKVHIHRTAGHLEESLTCLKQAENLVDPDTQPRLSLYVKQHRLLYLNEIGQPEAARELLPEVLQLVEQIGNRLERMRVQWAKGLILGKLKQSEAAEETLRKVREEFLQEGISYDAAQVSLDLAIILLESNRLEETRQLAEDMLPLFESLDIQREAFAALILFHRAALQDKATAGMVRDIAAFLKRTGSAPALKYEEPS